MKQIFYIFLFLFYIFSVFSVEADFTEPVLHKPYNISENNETRPNRDAPTGDEIISPAEFDKVDGVYLAWAGWALETITAIAKEVAEDDKVYLLVANYSQQLSAFTYLSSNDVNMSNVVFIHDSNISNTSIWIRDYFPFFIYEDGSRALDDFFYGIYGTDDDISYTIADEFDFPLYESEIMHHGGNYICDGNGMAFCSTNIFEYNSEYTEEEAITEMKDFLGIDSLIVVKPMFGDGTGHIDMFCKLLNDTLFVVGEYSSPQNGYPGDFELLNDLADSLSTLQNLDGRSFSVERIPMPAYIYGGPAGTYDRTYTNSLIINNKVLVPTYNILIDDIALNIYQDLMPGYDIIGIDSSYIIQYWGAIHCITNSQYSENPLIVFHEEIGEQENNTFPQIEFRLNPKFLDSQASVFYKLDSSNNFIEIEAELSGGIWTATLPSMTEDYEYYIQGNVVSTDTEFFITLPESAPNDVFYVNVNDVQIENGISDFVYNVYNYPNPFNPSTTIFFETTKSTKDTKIEIYNIKGQRICEFIIDNLRFKINSIVWDGKDDENNAVSSGIYFYKLQTEGFSQTKKMILIK
ncbi:MAG: agmatine deiminase family protein [Candidatus Cloacimonetes bacterium]|nr:agmatine deiminase family protein [Candidatus Cloacimonadota bacterium]